MDAMIAIRAEFPDAPHRHAYDIRERRRNPACIAGGGAATNAGPVEIHAVRRTAEEPLFNSLMDHHHYLAYDPIAGLAWSSAPRHLGSRGRYVGLNRGGADV
jgi:hypothetical protein